VVSVGIIPQVCPAAATASRGVLAGSYRPPSTPSVWPVTKAAWQLVRKSTAPAKSAGVPSRQREERLAIRARFESESEAERSVSKKPGAIELTRMPRGPSSRARLRAKPSIEALVAA
jgi:hypothetical protein